MWYCVGIGSQHKIFLKNNIGLMGYLMVLHEENHAMLQWEINFFFTGSAKSISLIARRSLVGRKSKPDRYTFRETDKKMDSGVNV